MLPEPDALLVPGCGALDVVPRGGGGGSRAVGLLLLLAGWAVALASVALCAKEHRLNAAALSMSWAVS